MGERTGSIKSLKWLAMSSGLALAVACAGTAMAQKGGGGGSSSPSTSSPQSGEKTKLEVGSVAPAISVDEWIQGRRLAKLEEGKVYVVEFWATWCPPCREAIPKLNEMYKEHKDSGLEVLAIASSERGSKTSSVSGVREFVKGRGEGMSYPVGVDTDGSMNRAWMKAAEQQGIPAAFVIDRSGKVAFVGNPHDEGFKTAVTAALGAKARKDKSDKKESENQVGKPRAEVSPKEGRDSDFLVAPVGYTPPAQSKAPATLREGDSAPALSTEAWITEGKLDGFQPGKVYVVDFWATWCKPCVAMMPELTELQRKYAESGLTVIGVAGDEQGKNMRDKVDTLRSWVKRNESRIGYSIAYDNNGSMRRDWLTASGRSGLPTAFVVDKRGRVAHIFSGSPMLGLEDEVREALGLRRSASGELRERGEDAGLTLVSFEQPADGAKKDEAKKEEPKKPEAPKAPTLNLGDAAPPLAVGKWVKGEEISGFEKGRTYVVEFWATWCGPCKQTIPHLTDLAKKYKDVPFIGVSVWENNQDDVEPFVKEMGDKMGYRVVMDRVGPAADDTPRARRDAARNGAMSQAWMAASGARGIPTAFIVNGEGRIAWTGHPMEMEGPLEAIVAGKWDLNAKAAEGAKARANDERMQPLRREYAQAQMAGDVDGQLKALDAMLALDAQNKGVSMQKFMVLLNNKKDYDGASKIGDAMVSGMFKDEPLALNQIAWSIVDPELKHEKKDLDLALKAASRAAELTKKSDPAVLDTLATVQFEKGDVAQAIETQTLAVEKAKGTPMLEELKDRLEMFTKAKK